MSERSIDVPIGFEKKANVDIVPDSPKDVGNKMMNEKVCVRDTVVCQATESNISERGRYIFSEAASCNIENLAERGNQGRKKYEIGKVLGNGSFGIVCEARCIKTGERIAIKKVLQDPKYKNRELDIMKELNHPNIVALKDFYYTEIFEIPRSGQGGHKQKSGSSGESLQPVLRRYLNVVMEHVPDTVYRIMKTFLKNRQSVPILLVKLYIYQLCRSLAYIHSLGICHRDIKPQNLLVDSKTHVLKLCDFGSAKRLKRGEPSVAYICSRFYRAPELMLGLNEYTTAIDIWSIGCVLGELLLGQPLFPGETSVDQLVKIIQIMGTPTYDQMLAMNPYYKDIRFPNLKPLDLRVVFRVEEGHVDRELAVDLLSQFLRYEPTKRLHPFEALSHKFFDELRDSSTRLPEGGSLPDLFTFTEYELRMVPSSLIEKVRPCYCEKL